MRQRERLRRSSIHGTTKQHKPRSDEAGYFLFHNGLPFRAIVSRWVEPGCACGELLGPSGRGRFLTHVLTAVTTVLTTVTDVLTTVTHALTTVSVNE